MFRVFRSSRLYDAQLLRHMWQYVYISVMLPTCDATQASVSAPVLCHAACAQELPTLQHASYHAREHM